ncbi:MAG: hypothetical protein HYR96_15760 [Deltaproteobacteria bacterium]|nr:hypothetical protein [Deltaproteobacteria bacterium]MBI3296510.1 hypothetical protein [Deltaproteobacteria bacterium]
MKVAHVKVRQMVDAITERLDCTQKVLCSFVGITPTSLSTTIDRPFCEVNENKVGKRLISLLYIVETLARDQSLTAPVIKKVLTTPCYRQEDGTYLDVVSAIHTGTIQNDLLTPIADAALRHFRNSYEAEKWPIAEGLYNRAINERETKSGHSSEKKRLG